ncbi:MAG TPA: DUF1634 domain-containing protein [Ktedonobacterales bacterium]|nr:DUF1634 domain-containing protein [Ktedonobacterales bacterium]
MIPHTHDEQPIEKAQGGQPARNREALIRQAELVISYVLRIGVLLSALIILVGVVSFYHSYFTASGHAVNTAAFPHTLGGVGAGLAHGDSLAIIMFGLLVLLMTPVARVVVSIVAFALERDWRYVVITSIVLCILIISFVLGRGGA